MYITLKPGTDAIGPRRRRSSRRSTIKCRPFQWHQAVSATGAGCQRRGTAGPHPVPIHLAGCQPGELNKWAPKILAKMQQIPLLTDVTSDQENSGTTETLTYDRDQASASESSRPRSTRSCTMRSASGRSRSISPATRLTTWCWRRSPNEFGVLSTCDKLYVHSSTGAVCRCRRCCTRRRVPVQPLAINHQSQFPSVTISFNLKGKASLGDAVTQVETHAGVDGRAGHSCRAASRARHRLSSHR